MPGIPLDGRAEVRQGTLPGERLAASRAVADEVGHGELDVRPEQRGVARPLRAAQLRPVDEDDAHRCCHAAILPQGRQARARWLDGRMSALVSPTTSRRCWPAASSRSSTSSTA